MDDDDDIFADLFDPDVTDGAIELTWEVASRCTTPRDDASPCFSVDSRQPNWNCTACGGLGALFSDPTTIYALFRGQSKWKGQNTAGQSVLGEAQLTTPIDVKPAWADDRIRDRFTVPIALGDFEAGTVFYPVAKPVPFLFAGVQRAWRVQLASGEQSRRTRPQP